jgi:hypothetical protein
VRALTVQQPWAWCIVAGGKDVENRTTAWRYRGPLAIHAGQRMSERGLASPLASTAFAEATGKPWTDAPWADVEAVLQTGAIIGVVDLVDLHPAHPGCCASPWAETQYVEHGGKLRRQLVHLVLEDPRVVKPIPCVGRLGLWTPELDVLEQLAAVTS